MTRQQDNQATLERTGQEDCAEPEEIRAADEQQGKRLGEILEDVQVTAERCDGDSLTVGDVADSFGQRAYGPLLVLPCVISLLPFIGLVPGLTFVMNTWIVLVAGQMLFSPRRLWLPGFVRRFSMPSETLSKGLGKARPYFRWIDWLIHTRLEFLAGPPFSHVVAALCVALGILLYPLGIIPGAVGPPVLAILLLALGLTARDGVLVALGTAASAGCAWFAWYALTHLT